MINCCNFWCSRRPRTTRIAQSTNDPGVDAVNSTWDKEAFPETDDRFIGIALWSCATTDATTLCRTRDLSSPLCPRTTFIPLFAMYWYFGSFVSRLYLGWCFEYTSAPCYPSKPQPVDVELDLCLNNSAIVLVTSRDNYTWEMPVIRRTYTLLLSWVTNPRFNMISSSPPLPTGQLFNESLSV